MSSLLSNHDQRMLDLLEKLNTVQDRILLSELSEDLNIPLRSLSTYIQEFNKYNSQIQISTSKQGAKLLIDKNESFRKVYKIIYENSLELTILDQLYREEFKTLEDIAEHNFISLSTAKRIFSKLKTILKKDKISLVATPLSIGGSEHKVREFFSYFYEEKFPNLEFITADQMSLLTPLINELFSERNITLPLNQINKYSRWMYLNAIRIKNNHRIKSDKFTFKTCSLSLDTNFSLNFRDNFGIDLTIENINDLLYHLNNHFYYLTYEKLTTEVTKSTEIRFLFDNTRNILHLMATTFNLPLSNGIENDLTLDIFNLITLKHTRNFILYDRKQSFCRNLFFHYPQIKLLLIPYIIQLLDDDFLSSDIHELVYILVTHWPGLFEHMTQYNKEVDIFIQVDTDLEHAFFIKKELESSCRYNIHCHVSMNLDYDRLSNRSILLTTLPPIDSHLPGYLVCFTDFLSAQNWMDINSIIRKIIINDFSSSLSISNDVLD